MNQLFIFATTMAVMLWIVDFALGCFGTPGAMLRGQYRRLLRWCGRQFSRLARWAWRTYQQFLLGIGVGILVALYFQAGRLCQ